MRCSGLLLAALVATTIAPRPAASGAMVAGFCGQAPPGWKPPWQRKPAAPSAPDTTCHLMLCDRRKAGGKAGAESPA
ncbi:hypothetical protein [Sphingobium sp. YR768]|uniref:hypothetical protein n=1 Tax=Sphingobium sp. YR768 TaxID=1884365 RepID=UPI0008BDE20C|nr:hypothetical protein [Sphingobium sp. YR768]SER65395.1 hypothetical protein SAMN05518866_11590 [Sphingobium sp. YR768]